MSKRIVNQNFNHWTLLGTNFTKADIHTRSNFALGEKELTEVYAKAKALGLNDFLVLSTCNRTEFYGCVSLELMKELVCDQLHISDKDLSDYFYAETGMEAVRHFFKVVSGLNSQIVGDYEIAGQVKKAIQFSRKEGLTATLTDRISSLAFQASKEVKTKTNLSHGKYSVSYAAAELIMSHRAEQLNDRILIVGTGEMGQSVARNLREYFPKQKLTVTNRTYENAERLAGEIKATTIPFETFVNQLPTFDVIITTAHSDEFLIRYNDAARCQSKLFLDLSVPQAIDPAIKNITTITHYSVDEISDFHNELMQQRLLEIPKAEKIIESFVSKLLEWQVVFSYRGVLLDYKEKMARPIHQSISPILVEKSFSGLIQQIKSEGYRGCSVIQTVNELIGFEK